MPSAKPQLLPLTGMRFFLALWVVVFHMVISNSYRGLVDLHPPALVDYILRAGYAAVGVFFALSGFILAYNYPLDRPWSPQQWFRFGSARFARIYPTYLFGMVLVAPFVAYTLRANWSAAAAGKAFGLALMNLLLLQAWIPSTALSWNGPGWSLSNEAFFYACFPVLGLLIWRIPGLPRLLTAALALWFLSLALPLAAVVLPLPEFGAEGTAMGRETASHFWLYLIKFNPLLRLPEFCMGIAACRIYQHWLANGSPLSGRGYWLYVPGLALEVLVIALFCSLRLPVVPDAFLLPAHALVILGLALGGGTVERLLAARPLVFLGNASFALYIVHSPVGLWMDLISRRMFGLKLLNPYVYLGAVVLLSSLFYIWAEEPLHRCLKKALVSSSTSATSISTPAPSESLA